MIKGKKCRGFYQNKYGKQGITVNGEYVRGEWKVGTVMYHTDPWWESLHSTTNTNIPYIRVVGDSLVTGYKVIPQTLGEWLCTDSAGYDIFENDIVGEVQKKYPSGDPLSIQYYSVIKETAKDHGFFRRFRKKPEVYVVGNIFQDTIDSSNFEKFGAIVDKSIMKRTT